jgi:hypothetical protein
VALKRKRRPNSEWPPPGPAWCPDHVKYSYPSRSAAKKVKSHDGQHLSVYQCDIIGGWHVGHLPPQIRGGQITRGEFYGKEEKK